MYPDYQYAPRKPGEKKRRASRKDMEAGAEKDRDENLRFIDQEGDFYMGSESGSGIADDDMEVIGTKVDEGIRRFHYDGEGNIGIALPVAEDADLTKMVEAHNKRVKVEEFEPCEFDPTDDVQVATDTPPHVQNDTAFFDALIDWEAIAEDFKIVRAANGQDLAGIGVLEGDNPYLSLSDEEQRAYFEAELERTLKMFN
jgi:hypothetical protein